MGDFLRDMYHKYPYTDFHELNLSWFLDEFKKLYERFNSIEVAWDEFNKKFDGELENTVKEKLEAWKEDGTLIQLLETVTHSIVNAVISGIDNTGAKDVGEDITELLEHFTGRKIYFPAGIYKINTTVRMRTDGDFRGNMLVCDPDAKFITDGIATMFSFGNGNYAETLEPFGFDGGYIDATGVRETVIFINDKQYSGRIKNIVIRNVGNCTGIKICNDTTTSSQVFIENTVITGNGSVTGDGILIYGTDNYLTNVDIGRMKRNLVIGGGGNKITNLHTWNYGREYAALGISTPDEKLTYPSIRVNGANVFTGLQVDNGSPAMQFTSNAVMNIVGEASFNYESDYPWATSTDKARAVDITGNNSSLDTVVKINSVNFAPPSGLNIRLIDFPSGSYDANHIYWLQKQTWDIATNASRAQLLRRLEGDFGRSIIDEKYRNVLAAYISNNNINKCLLLGYIGVNYKNGNSVYSFSDAVGGEIVIDIHNGNDSITVTGTKKSDMSNAGNLIIGTDIITLCDKKFVPVYIQFTTPGAIYNGVMMRAIKQVDCLTSFVSNRLGDVHDIPTNKFTIALR